LANLKSTANFNFPVASCSRPLTAFRRPEAPRKNILQLFPSFVFLRNLQLYGQALSVKVRETFTGGSPNA
jgi:hypothetical protein